MQIDNNKDLLCASASQRLYPTYRATVNSGDGKQTRPYLFDITSRRCYDKLINGS
jgi:hypothetical protein